MLLSRIRSAVWFLKRPSLYPQFAHLAWDRISHGQEPDTFREAEAWCGQRAVSSARAIELLTGSKPDGKLESLYPEVFHRAIQIERECPEWMGGPGDLDLLYYSVKRSNARRVVETGVAYGWSSLAILLALEGRDGARLISSDMPYVQGCNDEYVGCVVYEQRWRDRWKLVRKADRQVLPAAIRELGGIDLCHYDSDKSYRGRMWAYPLLWNALARGGIFLSDDISDNLAFRDWCAAEGLEPIVVLVENERHRKFVGALLKR